MKQHIIQTTVKTDHNNRIRRLSKLRACQHPNESGSIHGMKRFLKEKQPRGVVFLSHIPHGFYEEQIEAYFSQFGKVTAVSVPKSKTGRTRGFAFIEFKHPEVGEIAADTMNNYLMFCRLLRAKYIAPGDQKPRLFSMAKAAREAHRDAADKAALAVKHNRKLKNRHLKLGLEASCAARLLRKAKLLKNRARKLGLSHDFTVGETDLQKVLKRYKEIKVRK